MSSESEMSYEDMINNIQSASDSFQWTNEEKKCLDEIQEYHARMLETIARVRRQGPIKTLPKQPKRKLLELFKEREGTKKMKTKMTSSELNVYLQKHLVDVHLEANRVFFIDLENIHKSNDLSDGERLLKKGYQYIGRQNAESFLFYLQFGKLLNTIFPVFQNAKKRRKNTI